MTKDEIFEELLDGYREYKKGFIWEVSTQITEDEAELEREIEEIRQRYKEAE